MDMATLHPDINYVGIEMYDSVLLRALQKREKLETEGIHLDNLKFMCMGMLTGSPPEVFDKGEVERIHSGFFRPMAQSPSCKKTPYIQKNLLPDR